MLIKKDERVNEVRPKFKGGEGEFRLAHFAMEDQMAGLATLFAYGTLPAGSSVGMHAHEGTMEICCFTEGCGTVTEKDCSYEVCPGDVSICYDGECHTVKNTGEGDLKYIALVMKTGK